MNNLTNFIEISDKIFIGSKYDYIENKDIKDVFYVCATNTKNINTKQDTYINKNILYLNLIDANNIEYINKDAIEFFIDFYKFNKDKVFIIFCDQGLSRSPTLAAILLIINKDSRIKSSSFNEFLYKFKNIYREFQPNVGMLQFLQNFYEKEYKNV